jgi:hypothetical protein
MSLWWVPAGIAAWFLIAVVAGLCIGPVIGRCSQTREATDQKWLRTAAAGTGMARRDQNVTL